MCVCVSICACKEESVQKCVHHGKFHIFDPFLDCSVCSRIEQLHLQDLFLHIDQLAHPKTIYILTNTDVFGHPRRLRTCTSMSAPPSSCCTSCLTHLFGLLYFIYNTANIANATQLTLNHAHPRTCSAFVHEQPFAQVPPPCPVVQPWAMLFYKWLPPVCMQVSVCARVQV